MADDWTLFWHLWHIRTSGKCHHWKYNKPKIQENVGCLSMVTHNIWWANKNQAAVIIDEKHIVAYCWFFPTLESDLKATDMPKTVHLVE